MNFSNVYFAFLIFAIVVVYYIPTHMFWTDKTSIVQKECRNSSLLFMNIALDCFMLKSVKDELDNHPEFDI